MITHKVFWKLYVCRGGGFNLEPREVRRRSHDDLAFVDRFYSRLGLRLARRTA